MLESRLFIDMRAVLFWLLLAPAAALAEDVDVPRVIFVWGNLHYLSEAIQMQIGVHGPGNVIPGDTIIIHDLTVRDADGREVGQFSTEAHAAGFAEVTLETEAAAENGDSVIIVANGQPLGEVQPDTRFGQVRFQIEVEQLTAGRNPRTGETIKIPAAKVPSVATTIIDKFTGETKATSTVKWFNPEKGYGFISPSDSGR